MPKDNGISQAASAIITAGRFAAQHGWVPATSGNFSVRAEDGRIAITRSGRDKGTLKESDIVTFALDGPIPAGVSAETPLHVARYKADPEIGAVFHVHSANAALLSRLKGETAFLRLAGWELQKAFAGVASHETEVRVPVFANDQDTARLAAKIEAALGQPGEDSVAAPGYLLAGHGLYAWGAAPKDAERHLEAFDALFALELDYLRMTQ